MDDSFTMLAQEFTVQRLRARCAEQKLQDVEEMLLALGVALWETDRELRLLGSHGLVIADGYIDRPIADFYRDAYGMTDLDEDPMEAHRDARSGRRVALSVRHEENLFAILVEPKRDATGAVVGTIGMSLSLGAA